MLLYSCRNSHVDLIQLGVASGASTQGMSVSLPLHPTCNLKASHVKHKSFPVEWFLDCEYRISRRIWPIPCSMNKLGISNPPTLTGAYTRARGKVRKNPHRGRAALANVEEILSRCFLVNVVIGKGYLFKSYRTGHVPVATWAESSTLQPASWSFKYF